MLSIGILGFIGASLDGEVRFISQEAGVWVQMCPTFGSPSRRLSWNTMLTVGSNLPVGGCSVETTITRKTLQCPLKPARAIHSGHHPADNQGDGDPRDIRHDKSSDSVRIRDLPRTDASASPDRCDERDLRLDSTALKRSSKALNECNHPVPISHETTCKPDLKGNQTYRGDAGEIRKTPEASNRLSGEIVSASANAGSNRKKINDGQFEFSFEDIVSPENLRGAWVQLRSNPGMLTRGATPETLDQIEATWFEQTSRSLIKGNFVYPYRRRIAIPKPGRLRRLTISNPRIKVIERAILNGIEPFFEGCWTWTPITEQEYISLKTDTETPNNDLKRNKGGYFKKSWKYLPRFHSSSYGFRPHRSVHGALQAVKHWRTNTAWMLDFDIRKAFDNVNRRRLKNIFISHINEPRLWKEIEKMMNAGIVDPSLHFEDLGVPFFQGSVLSPFLFNVYMNELDAFMKQLALEASGKTSTYNKQVEKEYNRITAEFSNQRLGPTLAKYGSIEAMKEALRMKKKEHYKNCAQRSSTHSTYFVQYVRYADDFKVGVGGPKEFASDIQKRINTFIKSDLHLEVKQSKIISRNEGPSRFLGFLIHLAKFHKKTRIKWNKFASIAKYKRRVRARLIKSDVRLAKAAVHEMNKNILEALRRSLSEKGERFCEHNTALAAERLAIKLSSNKENPALKRWVKHFEGLFDQELSLALKFYRKQICDLATPEGDDFSCEVAALRDKFLFDLDEIEQKSKLQFFETRRAAVLEQRRKQLNREVPTSQISPTLRNMSEETAIKAADVLTESFLDRARKVSIKAPLTSLIDTLASNGYYHPIRRKPSANIRLTNLNDSEIITCFAQAMYGLMNYYRPSDNYNNVKGLVEGLRRSCCLTLGLKHKKPAVWVYNVYGEDIKIELPNGKSACLPSRSKVANISPKFLISEQVGFDLEALTRRYYSRYHLGANMFSQCAVRSCLHKDIQIHHLRG